MVVEIDNVELSFGVKTILNGVYLKAETGKVTGLLGRNGSGKSSLLSIIFGSLQPKYKLVRVDKKPVVRKLYTTGKVYLSSQIQTIPNFMKLHKAFYLQQISWTSFVSDFPQLEKYKNKRPENLSSGELQLVEIYLALFSNKPIILLDEPFMHIAPIYVEKVKEFIKQQKNNKAIILTDHYYQTVIDVADDIYLLKNRCT
ncbi:ATP-binding cassette domain-containing protein [Spongiivirga sp. MCCC 1A20706]|uniref:ATP-binding cassette domain-containing protein n=1 Tax=Spongiivirga sp. MCCC 1A20706 TaxID=3160963 RepID=UPI003977BD98